MSADGAVGRSASRIRLIEQLAANAWPAYIEQSIDGWRVRHTPGVRARRSNSVLPLDATGPTPLDERLAAVERFYESRGLPARFQLSPVSAPKDLDAVLADRGYEVDTPVEVQAAPLEEVLDRTAFASAAVDVASTPDEGWLFLWTELFRRGDPVVTRERVLDRIAPATGFALLERGDDPVAVGFGVVERGWMGIFGMATVPGARRGGAATAVLNALAGWAEGLEAKDCYLQVEAGNAPALGLYERSGFRTLYRYHYRTGHSRIRRPA